MAKLRINFLIVIIYKLVILVLLAYFFSIYLLSLRSVSEFIRSLHSTAKHLAVFKPTNLLVGHGFIFFLSKKIKPSYE